jgi:uncharacterized surface protein with fasciclin (FAS1) repeats
MANIIELAKEGGHFKTLITAIEKSGLVDTLTTGGPFTVFCPTDEAFAEIPEDQLNELLEQPEKLKQIILYHAVPGKIMSKDLSGKMNVKTVQGQEVMIDATDGVMVNDAKVIRADVEADNGVAHVIDKVILPK